LGKCDILPGIDLAVRTMQRRERAKFIISSDLLYGELGCTPHIPESAWCVYIIELVSTNESSMIPHDEQSTIKVSDDYCRRIRLAQTLRNQGNEEYANGHLDRALRSYNKAKQLIYNRVTLIDRQTEEQYHHLLLKLHLNSGSFIWK
jgi:FK506-binding protein 6